MNPGRKTREFKQTAVKYIHKKFGDILKCLKTT